MIPLNGHHSLILGDSYAVKLLLAIALLASLAPVTTAKSSPQVARMIPIPCDWGSCAQPKPTPQTAFMIDPIPGLPPFAKPTA